MKLKPPGPPETVVLPGAPEKLRRERDRAIAALVLKQNLTISEAAERLDGVMTVAFEAASRALDGE